MSVASAASLAAVARRAQVICGYGSTALVEMMGTNLPIISADWPRGRSPDMAMMEGPGSEVACRVARGPSAFGRMLREAIVEPRGFLGSLPALRDARDRMIDRYVFRIDGSCSERVARMIRAECASSKG